MSAPPGLDSAQLDALERACEVLYTTSDDQARRSATEFTSIVGPPTPETLDQLVSLLSQPHRSAYAHLFSASTLSRLLTEHWDSVPQSSRRSVLSSCVSHLLSAPPTAPHFVTKAVVRLFSRVTKWLWADTLELHYYHSSYSDEDDEGDRANRDSGSGEMGGTLSLFRQKAELVSVVSKMVPLGEGVSVMVSERGLLLLGEVVREFSLNDGPGKQKLSPLRHKQAAFSFMDDMLYVAVDSAVAILREEVPQGSDPAVLRGRRDAALKVLHACLSYDFYGTGRGTLGGYGPVYTLVTPSGLVLGDVASDEGAGTSEELREDVDTIVVPPDWRDLFESVETSVPGIAAATPLVPLLFREYQEVVARWPDSSSAVVILECLLQMAAVSRSIFTSEESLTAFTASLVEGIVHVFNTRAGLSRQENHHALCRLIAQLRFPRLLPLASSHGELWTSFFNLSLEFTRASIAAWQWSPNSVHYALRFWAQTAINSIGRRWYSLPAPMARAISGACASVVAEFLKSKLSLIEASDEALSSLEAVSEQLQNVSPLLHADYKSVVDMFVRAMDSQAAALGTPAGGDSERKRLAWLCHFSGACLTSPGRDSDGVAASMDSSQRQTCDALLTSRIVRAARICSAADAASLVPGGVRPEPDDPAACLRLATLSALRCVHTAYLLNHEDARVTAETSAFCTKLASELGMPSVNATDLVSLFVSEIKSAVSAWTGSSSEIFRAAIDLLSVFAESPLSSKVLRESGAAKSMVDALAGISSTTAGAVKTSKWRCAFYEAISRILLYDPGIYVEDSFPPYRVGSTRDMVDQHVDDVVMPMEPFLQTLLAARNQPTKELCSAITACLRDLRGVLQAIDEPETFRSFFGWLHPTYTPLLSVGVSNGQIVDLDLSLASLKLLCSLLKDEHDRLTKLGSRVPDGPLLVHLAGDVVGLYAGPLLSALRAIGESAATPDAREKATDLYRAVAYLLSAAGEALEVAFTCPAGGFGQLYGDTSLQTLVGISLSVATALPHGDVAVFPKLTRAFYSLIAVSCSFSLVSAVYQTLSVESFTALLSALENGLQFSDLSVLAATCSALSGLLSSYLTSKRMYRRGPERVRLVERDRAQATMRFEELLAAATAGRSDYQPLQSLAAVLVKQVLLAEPRVVPLVSKPLVLLCGVVPSLLSQLAPFVLQVQPRPELREALSSAYAKLVAASVDPELDPLNAGSQLTFTHRLSAFQKAARTLSHHASKQPASSMTE